MKKATVTFIRYYTYEVEISDETYYDGNGWDAVEKAKENFESDVFSPSASTWYDDVEVEFEDEE